MYGLMSLFPHIIDDVVKVIPDSLLVVQATEHVGFSLLRKAYLLATIASFFLFVASLLDDAYYLRSKARSVRNALREAFKFKPRQVPTSADVSANKIFSVDIGWLQAATISAAIPVFFALSYHYEWKFVDMRYGPAGPLLSISQAFHGHTNLMQDTNSHTSFVEENSLCGLVGKAVKKAITAVVNEIDEIGFDILYKLGNFTESVFHFSSIITSFENIGTSAVNILHETWDVAEKTLVLIVPLLISILITATAFVLPHVSSNAKEEIEKTVKQLSLIGIYYNVALLVMMQQLFATVSNLNLHLFYFRFESGFLVPIGFIASGLNALSLFSLYVNKIYQVEQ
jgi:hypothetical protein